MKTLIFTFLLALNIQSVMAKKSCTDAQKDKWMNEKDFKEMLVKKGYTIEKFKQPGTCFEIYGKNSKGQNVEVYFDPTNGNIVKEEIE